MTLSLLPSAKSPSPAEERVCGYQFASFVSMAASQAVSHGNSFSMQYAWVVLGLHRAPLPHPPSPPVSLACVHLKMKGWTEYAKQKKSHSNVTLGIEFRCQQTPLHVGRVPERQDRACSHCVQYQTTGECLLYECECTGAWVNE